MANLQKTPLALRRLCKTSNADSLPATTPKPQFRRVFFLGVIPTYELLERRDISALIDINSRAKTSENAPPDVTFNKNGTPSVKEDIKCARGEMTRERIHINTAARMKSSIPPAATDARPT